MSAFTKGVGLYGRRAASLVKWPRGLEFEMHRANLRRSPFRSTGSLPPRRAGVTDGKSASASLMEGAVT